MECCSGGNVYGEEFSPAFAESTARSYVRRGLSRVAGRMAGFLETRGVEGTSVLEIGGGVGSLCIDLLRRGADRATCLDLSPNYEESARALAQRYGVEGRLTRQQVDIARTPDAVPPADVVVLKRVVCCYPDCEALLAAAGDHARSRLVMSYPRVNPASRALLWAANGWNALRGREFRGYLHEPSALLGIPERSGLSLVMEHRGPVWSVAGFERPTAA